MIIIRTTTRTLGVDYLPELVGAIERERVRGTILTDGPIARQFPGWCCVATGSVLGSRLSGWRALELIAQGGADTLLLEDDVLPVPGGITRMLDQPIPGYQAFCSFFDIRVTDHHPRLSDEPCKEFMQAQAVKFPASTAAILARCDPTKLKRASFSDVHAFDLCVGVYCDELVSPLYGLLLPNLVEHRGDVSAVEPGRPWNLRSGWLDDSAPTAGPGSRGWPVK
jgi:hypothetical protein